MSKKHDVFFLNEEFHTVQILSPNAAEHIFIAILIHIEKVLR